MGYIIADIHGCYNEYINLLRKIKDSRTKDTLYILRDVVDRGPEPIKNIARYDGNEKCCSFYWQSRIYDVYNSKKLTVEITAENCENYLGNR